MAISMVPFEERGLSPAEVEAIDRRRRHGHLYLVLGWQFLIVSVFVTLFSGQDMTYSPGWIKPLVYWDAFVFVLSMAFFVKALRLRRGLNEFFSY